MKVLILGAKGNLGVQLTNVFGSAGHEVSAYDREEIDALDFPAVRALVRSGGWDVVMNAVAWNDVDGAEDPDKRAACWGLNAELPRVLAEACALAEASCVHFSTDYVFSGAKDGDYDESDEPDPISEYGRSMGAGERGVLSAGGRGFVCRTSKLFGPAGASAAAKPSFVEVIMKAGRTKPELKVVDEELGCPTYTLDLARAAHRLVTGDFEPGVYHLVSSGPGVTWYGFTQDIFREAGINTPLQPVPMSAFPRPAARPKSAVLRNTKFPPLRSRDEALREFLADIVA